MIAKGSGAVDTRCHMVSVRFLALFLFVTEFASGIGAPLGMTVDAPFHRSHIGYSRHDIQLCDVSVAGIALQPHSQMRSMTPVDFSRKRVDSDPGNGLAGPGELREILYSGAILRNTDVTSHASGSRRKCHTIARLWIWMAILAFQTQRQMRFVTVRDRLRRSGRGGHRLLRDQSATENRQRSKDMKNHRSRNSGRSVISASLHLDALSTTPAQLILLAYARWCQAQVIDSSAQSFVCLVLILANYRNLTIKPGEASPL
jgi:hypothetical protein